MFDVILVSHGPLAKALLESAEFICGEQERVKTLGLYLGDSVDEFRERVRSEIEESLSRGEALVLTDIQCGSPFNVTCSAMGELDFIHITGANLPCVIQALSDRIDLPAAETARNCIDFCGGSIVHVNDLLEVTLAMDEDEDEDEE